MVLDPSRYGRDFQKVVDEVIANLKEHSVVEIRLEVTAESVAGFPEHVVRTVTENANVLRFTPGSGFME